MTGHGRVAFVLAILFASGCTLAGGSGREAAREPAARRIVYDLLFTIRWRGVEIPGRMLFKTDSTGGSIAASAIADSGPGLFALESGPAGEKIGFVQANISMIPSFPRMAGLALKRTFLPWPGGTFAPVFDGGTVVTWNLGESFLEERYDPDGNIVERRTLRGPEDWRVVFSGAGPSGRASFAEALYSDPDEGFTMHVKVLDAKEQNESD